MHEENPTTNPEKLNPVVEVVDIDGEDFLKLKQDMYISDRYEKTLRKLSASGQATVIAVKIGDRYVGRVTLRHDWSDNSPGSYQSVTIEEEFPGLPQVNALEVDENYRRRGLATLLLAAVENEARQQGFSQIGLGVEISNEPAKGLYEKSGYHYQKIGDQDTYEIQFSDPDPQTYRLYLMTKDLKG